jgi:hypothetical protein
MQLNWFMGRRASTVLKVATSSRSAPVFTLRAIAVDWRRTSLPIGFDRDRRRCTCCPHQTKRQKHDPLGMDDKLYSYLRRQWCNALRWMGYRIRSVESKLWVVDVGAGCRRYGVVPGTASRLTQPAKDLLGRTDAAWYCCRFELPSGV